MNELKITNFKPYQRGSLAAFFTLTLPSGLTIGGKYGDVFRGEMMYTVRR